MFHIVSAEGFASFATLTFLEIILGIDNIIFLSVAVQRLDELRRPAGRQIGLGLAMLLRIFMLVALVWATNLDVRLFYFIDRYFTIKDLVLIVGGLFLLVKGTGEIHDAMDQANQMEPNETASSGDINANMIGVVVQIGLINIVFSLDSVVTAVGMTNNLPIMIAAVVASTLVMLFAAEPVGDFIHKRPTTKMLALAFILLIGVALVADGLGFHIPRGYVYFAIAFSLFVEWLNSALQARRGRRPRQ